jgi:glycosyltransferase involved in cell wall biosynthesis
MKLALVHDWFPSFRGGERVASEIVRTFPCAEIYTLFDFLDDATKKEYFGNASFKTSLLNNLAFVEYYYKSLFFLCPFFIEQFDVMHHDAVIASSAAYARGVLTRPDQPFLCYVHSPVRYAWDQTFEYINQANLGFGPKGLAFRYFAHRMRQWDVRTANSPDLTLANSTFVRERIRRIYGRDAEVVFPPVHLNEMQYLEAKDDYYVCASFLVPYKRVDIVVRAFNAMPNRRLMILGEGSERKALQKIAGPNISFAGHLPRREFVQRIASARALVFAGCEDFGIVMAEAQCCGTPVVAFGRGGARDIVLSEASPGGATGILFDTQSAEALRDAVEHLDTGRALISAEACRDNGQRFSTDRFRAEIRDALDRTMALKKKNMQI